jgi:hypothetical protein
VPEANFRHRSQNGRFDTDPSAPEASDRWCHDIRRLDPERRVSLAGIVPPQTPLHGRVAHGCWVLRPNANGQVSDSRARLRVPVGIRYLVELGTVVGLRLRSTSPRRTT